MEIEFPKRKIIRLRAFDYSTQGAYFITICTYRRKNILSDIVEEIKQPPQPSSSNPLDQKHSLLFPERSFYPCLTPYGKIAEKWIQSMSIYDRNYSVDCYVIMPNHIHLLLSIIKGEKTAPAHTINAVVGWLKYQITKEIKATQKGLEEKIFQRSFYDHVIRSNDDYNETYKYINENPARWTFDRLNPEFPGSDDFTDHL